MQAKGPTSEGSEARWVSTAKERPRWDERNRMLAAYVPPGSAVVDLGAGAQSLRDHLPPGCEYQPCDVVPGDGVLPCDLDSGQWPELGRAYDIAVCSGVLEYMSDVESLLQGLSGVAHRALVTYCDRGRGQRIATRVAQGWQNHLTLQELRQMLDRLDGDWQFLTEWRRHVIVAIDFQPGLPPLRQGDVLVEEASWERAFAQLEAHAHRTGTAAIANSHVEDGVGLGAWAQSQRRLRRRGTLSPRRTNRLESLPGWSWRGGTSSVSSSAVGEPAAAYDALRPQRIRGERLEWMARAAQGDRVLDVACGPGAAVVEVARSGFEVVGFESDPVLLEQARARLSEETGELAQRVSLLTGDPAALPFDDASFDTILVGETLEDADGMLDEIARLVRPRGCVVMAIPLEASAREAGRRQVSLHELLSAMRTRLRPVEIVEGDRWMGIVAVALAHPDEVSASTAWTAFLEIAEHRLARLDDAHAERAARLEEVMRRERELVERVEQLAASQARSEEQRLGAVRRAGSLEQELETAKGARAQAQEAHAILEARLADVARERDGMAERAAMLAEETKELTARVHDAGAQREELEARLHEALGRHGDLESEIARIAAARAELEARLAEVERERADLDARLLDTAERAAAGAAERELRFADALERATAAAEERERRFAEQLAAAAADAADREGRLKGEAAESERRFRKDTLALERRLRTEAAEDRRGLVAEAGARERAIREAAERAASDAGERERALAERLRRAEDAIGARERRLAEVREHGRAFVREAEDRQTRIEALEAEVSAARAEAAAAARATREAAGRAVTHQRRAATFEQRSAESARRATAAASQTKRMRAEQADQRAEVRRLLERILELETELEGERGELARRAEQVRDLRSGRAYRWAQRWWRFRRAVLRR